MLQTFRIWYREKAKQRMHYLGPLLLAFLGALWLLQGYSILAIPEWFGAILLGIGLARFALYFLDVY